MLDTEIRLVAASIERGGAGGWGATREGDSKGATTPVCIMSWHASKTNKSWWLGRTMHAQQKGTAAHAKASPVLAEHMRADSCTESPALPSVRLIGRKLADQL